MLTIFKRPPPPQKNTLFTTLQLSQLDPKRIPRHIAIIPDGNRRWAKKRFTSPQEGHREGADSLMEVVKAAKELGVNTITFYVFSTENWERPTYEVQALIQLFTNYIHDRREEMIECGIKLETIGQMQQFPNRLVQVVDDTKEATKHCDKINLVLAMNYGARNELSRAFRAMLDDYAIDKLKKEEIDESTIASYLDTAKWGDPDLLIRTSGELRLSNFLLWQISYAEIHIAPVLWPDFQPEHLLNAVKDYQSRDRRWGKI